MVDDFAGIGLQLRDRDRQKEAVGDEFGQHIRDAFDQRVLEFANCQIAFAVEPDGLADHGSVLGFEQHRKGGLDRGPIHQCRSSAAGAVRPSFSSA
jgi:hypothetical protein